MTSPRLEILMFMKRSFKKYLKVRLADGTREFYNTNDITKIDFAYKKANSDRQLKKI